MRQPTRAGTDARPRPFRRGGRSGRQNARPEIQDGRAILYGWHPVVEALRNPRRRHLRLLATENGARRLAEELGNIPLSPEIVRADEISRLLEPDAVHQGFYLESEALEGPGLDGLSDTALVLALDQVTDPHNVGAIVRTAAAFGVEAIITTARHSPAATGVLAKAASGGLEHVPFLVVRNLAEALIALGERGFRRVGLDSEGALSLAEVPAVRPTILVLGAEGKGLRQRTKECCDVVARLDMPGAIKSLNVSNAAAVALFALSGRMGSG
ncbi:TrmH family RNA methyltransferase [Enterovirga aerilata]|uniref:RNA methyltransferase n=1 Tax=Enterovirga aerilata TaxID=2730920 RepID=A0A849I847_9HYPH|nr:RNA methyltransferase [Enterovirga sp. DB1703]NNM72579.1 RNA methyltransferase [Enterovirga sp. DB1703]